MPSDVKNHLSGIERRLGVVGKEHAKCKVHGDYIAVIRESGERTGCPNCREKERAEEERLRKLEQFVCAHRSRAKIPRRFEGKTFADYSAKAEGQRKALEICAGYAADFGDHLKAGRCMLMLGKVGTGKTHLAVAIANFLIHERGISAIYRTVGGIIDEIRSTYDGGKGGEAEIMKILVGSDLLVLDEVGATKATDFELATLFRIINGRYEQCLPTIIVSNLGPKELPAALGERCVDRLRENGGILVPFDWESARSGVKA
ncbi:ATP-binding protein [Azotobacter beijerinckii]|uniref:DNA replication protein DnaC n=1 Tax=Azotobacter beijerinckii TaxID=170623 RepID=A0A1I4H9A6_9GAMM|nr:ATP-binding protein [Azotobacter beijerinckii]SFB60167.1 DNA replication protein DnaC [Azotobacter beijerinckii]SFL38243.1 DNA replication protein DnaC [Azotobacter beijerinckii]